MNKKQLLIAGAIIVAATLAIAAWAVQDLQMFPMQDIVLHSCPGTGLILDIGGGGEGIIGRLMGDRVVAIDLSLEELEGAPAGNIKMVMDAGEMAFLDNSFHTATSFCTLMYIKDQDAQRQVLAEVLRVLKPGGRLFIWDVEVPAEHKDGKTTAVFPLKISLPGDTVRTAYGVAWPQEPHDLSYYARLGALAGFEVADRKQNGLVISLELVKPYPESEEATPINDHHHGSSDESMFEFAPKHEVAPHGLPVEGPVLDIGGGGEGVIGRLEEDRVLAIDISKPELGNAPGAPVKAVMDALDMPVVSGSVANVTAFYALMYFRPDDLDQLFQEVRRVMVDGGRFLVWDVSTQQCPEGKEFLVYVLTVTLPDTTIDTGYGMACPENERNISTYKELAERHGFTVVRESANGPAFFLELEAS
ncbi:MAG: methyltransferase domain-containing protein [bacterium]|nr:methyltransferase domain-containing protein [bacterium]